jgi:hypothetical protein
MWTIFVEKYDDLSGTDAFQKATIDDDCVLRAVKAWLYFQNNPTFTSVSMKIYSNNGGVPGKLLHTCTNVQLKADLFSQNSAVVETYFEFNYPTLKAGDSYHFVIQASGYTGSDTSFISWKKAYPDPVNTTGLTINPVNLGTNPLAITFYTADL